MDEITTNIFLGNILAATNENMLKEVGIKNILRVLDNEKVDLLSGFYYFYLKVKDKETEDIAKHFDKAIEFIDFSVNRNEKILVHCYAEGSIQPDLPP
ncbi:unnamed protein product [Blepharisma stoltei]|uniref:Dual specificity phosphatase catalytic domain-containing protein n=1 Tax=Blepharisma stoltei TaxID=1481888 RepID=A0AAU9J787_9CILI|nr:unnamed protein product [Blepharisma stoltei]